MSPPVRFTVDRGNRSLAIVLPGGLALAGVAVSTRMSFHLGQGFAFTGFLNLVLVVLAAMYGGFRQATVVPVAAAACLKYFFVPPIFGFVNSPADSVAPGAYADIFDTELHSKCRSGIPYGGFYE